MGILCAGILFQQARKWIRHGPHIPSASCDVRLYLQTRERDIRRALNAPPNCKLVRFDYPDILGPSVSQLSYYFACALVLV